NDLSSLLYTMQHTQQQPTLFPYTTLLRSDTDPGLASTNTAIADTIDRRFEPLCHPVEACTARGECPKAPNCTGSMDRLRSSVCSDRKSTRLNSSHVKISYAVF